MYRILIKGETASQLKKSQDVSSGMSGSKKSASGKDISNKKSDAGSIH
jgi:hypothetical protein